MLTPELAEAIRFLGILGIGEALGGAPPGRRFRLVPIESPRVRKGDGN